MQQSVTRGQTAALRRFGSQIKDGAAHRSPSGSRRGDSSHERLLVLDLLLVEVPPYDAGEVTLKPLVSAVDVPQSSRVIDATRRATLLADFVAVLRGPVGLRGSASAAGP
jgi:hypothetical protein